MTTYLVDTHALLWFLLDDPQLSPRARREMCARDNVLLVSAASTWEIAIKARLGKLDAPEDLLDVVRDQGFDELPVTAIHAWRVRDLPRVAHRDPFDRLLVAQALAEDLPLVSGDEQLDQYGVDRRW